ncbi:MULTISPECIES: hypothetical protein [unclassified Microcoleus]
MAKRTQGSSSKYRSSSTASDWDRVLDVWRSNSSTIWRSSLGG